MAYNELIKNFDRVRDYMREFYVYGFRTRSEIGAKSTRSYDEERRHIEDYLGEYMGFNSGDAGRQVFLSFDSRQIKHNPLYEAWKAKSFTNADVFLHFTLLDILYDGDTLLTQQEIMDEMEEYNDFFADPMTLDESTIRKKLAEYVSLGLLRKEKNGRTVLYGRGVTPDISSWRDAVNYFSEVSCVGAIGSFILDNLPGEDVFTYKHHYITQTMDSEIMLNALSAIHERRSIKIKTVAGRDKAEREIKLTPLKIYVSVQNGRQYIFGCNAEDGYMGPYRLDYIRSIDVLDEDPDFSLKKERFAEISKHIWGVSSYGARELTHVEFTIRFSDDEKHIPERLMREKRCGTVEILDENTAKFTADVYNAGEMYPWIRTFICRITELHISDKRVEEQFLADLNAMYDLYLA